MGSRSSTELLQLPVRLHGIQLGRPVDILLDPDESRALGFVVRCRDEVERFLVFGAGEIHEDEIALGSALLLLEDVEFYRTRGRSVRALLGSEVEGAVLTDLLLADDGEVTGLD